MFHTFCETIGLAFLAVAGVAAAVLIVADLIASAFPRREYLQIHDGEIVDATAGSFGAKGGNR